MAGPEVTLIGAPNSEATMVANVVLPNPGGPESRTWSAEFPLCKAALKIKSNCSLTRCWPTNSAKVFGLSAPSTWRSSSLTSKRIISKPISEVVSSSMFIDFYSIFLMLNEVNQKDRLHFQDFQLVQQQLLHLFYSNQDQQER